MCLYGKDFFMKISGVGYNPNFTSFDVIPQSSPRLMSLDRLLDASGPQQPAQILFGRPVIPHVKTDSEVDEIEYTDFRTGELVGMSQGGHIVAMNKDGDIVETHSTDVLSDEPYCYTKEVSSPDGRIKSFEERRATGPVVRLEDKGDGEVVETEDYLTTSFPVSNEDVEAVKAYNASHGLSFYA